MIPKIPLHHLMKRGAKGMKAMPLLKKQGRRVMGLKIMSMNPRVLLPRRSLLSINKVIGEVDTVRGIRWKNPRSYVAPLLLKKGIYRPN